MFLLNVFLYIPPKITPSRPKITPLSLTTMKKIFIQQISFYQLDTGSYVSTLIAHFQIESPKINVLKLKFFYVKIIEGLTHDFSFSPVLFFFAPLSPPFTL